MSFVIDLDMVCLVCLQEGELRSVFDKDGSNGLTFGDKIMKCSDLCIEKDMKIPDKICDSCIADLNIAYRFRQNCDTANSVFESITKEEYFCDSVQGELPVQEKKIRIPSGIKIKRILPIRDAITIKKELPLPSENPITKTEEQEKQEENDIDEEENCMVSDYFENAETLEEDELFETCNVHDSQEAKLSESVKAESDNNEKECQKTFVHANVKEEFNNVTEEQKPKRGRGRPRKIEKSAQTKRYSIADKKSFLNESDIRLMVKPKTESLSMRYYSPRKKTKSFEVKPPKICDICGNSYKYQHALNSHMRRHRNERPFNCEFCDKAFVSAVELRRHMRVHTGQKPYACQYCERRFSDFGSRIKHERTHTGERPYACSTCGKAFAYAHVLSVHMRTHTGEKKFRCGICGKGFTKKVYLESHMSHHNIQTTINDIIEFKHVDMEECILTTLEEDDVIDVKIKIDPTIAEDDEIHYEAVEVP